MQSERRTFLRLGLAGAMGCLVSRALRPQAQAKGIKIGTFFKAEPTADDFAFLKNTAVEYVSVWTTIQDNNYDFMIRTRRRFESQGIQVYNIGILDLHCDPTIVLGLEGFEKKVQQYKDYLTNLGRAGIRYTTYAHMSNIKGGAVPGFYQTAVGTTSRGYPTREFDLEVAKKLPLSFGRVYESDHIWKTFANFIRAVMPVAEKAGVRIGLHPDDPPVESLGGVARIFANFEGYQRALEIANSENFGYCFCVGTWAEGGKMMGKDVIEMIRLLGPQKRIFKVHFRNVTSPLPKFRETFVDNGYLDMYQVMRALREVNFDGTVIPDHVPGGGFQPANDAFTIGYMKALRDRVNAEFQSA
jgi:mannonate dehydratase